METSLSYSQGAVLGETVSTGMIQRGEEQSILHPAIFATLAVWCRPGNLGTADCGVICRGEDGCDYVIKDGVSKNSTPLVPHCEWFCTELGEMIQIAAPPHKVIDMRDGTFAFGSRWLGGLVLPSAGGDWTQKVKRGEIDLASIGQALSHIYAFDQFVYNVDRHIQNFIVHEQNIGHAVLANDYSRAWIRHDFPLPAVPLPQCNTVLTQKSLVLLWGVAYINPTEVDVTLDKIRRITRAQIERIFNNSPQEWLLDSTKNEILSWWGSPEMIARIDAISAGVKNGSYL